MILIVWTVILHCHSLTFIVSSYIVFIFNEWRNDDDDDARHNLI